MKRNIRLLCISTLTVGALITSFISISSLKERNKATAYDLTGELPTTINLNDTSEANIRSYYSSLNNLSESEKQGTNLLKNLKPILKNNQAYYGYDSGGDNIWKIYEIVDRDWEKSPATDLNKSGSATYGEGTYNQSTNTITNYKYGKSVSNHQFDPYIHALYVNRNVDNQTTAWSDHNQSQWGINREHIWPKSQGFNADGNGGARGDLMHLWAGNGKVNGAIHNDHPFGFVNLNQSYTSSEYSNLSGNYYGKSLTISSGKSVFEPQDCDKGDIARAVFYMVARYNYYSGEDSDGIDADNPNLELVQEAVEKTAYTSNTSTKGQMGILSDLLAWNRLDPPDEFEIHRNNLLFNNYTHNRNPFIDYPEWAEFIWGKTTLASNNRTVLNYSSTPTGYANPTTDSVGGFDNVPTPVVDVTSVTLNKNSLSLLVNQVETLTATVLPNNATYNTVSWSSNNTNVATVSSSGVVTAVAAGTATITAEAGGKSASCTVTVTTASGGSNDYTLYSGALTEGDYVIYYNGKAMKNTLSSNRLTYSEVTPSNNTISNPASDIVWHIAPSGNYWTIFNGATSKYAGSTGTKNQAALLNSAESDNALWTVSGESTYEFVNKANDAADINRHLRNNGTYGFACYSTSTGGALSLYKLSSVASKTLSSIALSNQVSEFTVEDEFIKPTVTATYSDSSTADVTTVTTFTGYNMNQVGNYTVTASYTEGSITKTATYSITVKDREIISSNSPYLNGVSYRLYFTKNSKNYYFTGEMNGYYATTSTTYTQGKDVYFEQNGDGQNLYFYNENVKTYITIVLSGNYKNVSLTTDEPTYIWKYSEDYQCIYAVIDEVNYTISNRSDQNYTTFGIYYFGSNVIVPAFQYTAESFSSRLLNEMTCDSTGNNLPTFKNYDWDDLNGIYSGLDEEEKTTLKNALANESGSTIEKAMARYDYLMSKYYDDGIFDNFISRNISHSNYLLVNKQSTNNIIIFVVIIFSLSLSVFLFQKKRKLVN